MSQTVILRPTGQGAINSVQWGTTYCANWGTAWEQVCEEVCDDSSYFGVGPYGGAGQWGEKSFILSDPYLRGAIQNVTILARCAGHTSYANTAKTLIYIGGTKYYGDLVYLNSDSSFHDLITSYGLNPATGLPWTWDDVRSLEAGAYMTSTYATDAKCSWGYAAVTFRPASPARPQIIGLPW